MWSCFCFGIGAVCKQHVQARPLPPPLFRDNSARRATNAKPLQVSAMARASADETKASEALAEWPHSEELVISKSTGYYNRSSCDESFQVVKLLCEAYGVTDGFVTPSGMAAIACALHAACNGPDVWLLHSKQLYADTPKLCASIAKMRGCTRVPFDVQRAEQDLKAALGDEPKKKNKKIQRAVLFVEAASNPGSHMLPSKVIEWLHSRVRHLCVIVDNTWLSVQIYNPFRYGADMVVSSLTKYGSGGTVIAGCVLSYGSHKVMVRAQKWRRMHGQHVSPHTYALLLDTLPSQRARVAAASAVACEAAKWLQLQPHVVEVLHLSLVSHPSHEQARAVCTRDMWPGVVAFRVDMPMQEAKAWMRACSDIIPHVTSFGAPESRTDPWPREGPNGTTWCRLAVGFQDTAVGLMSKLCSMTCRDVSVRRESVDAAN